MSEHPDDPEPGNDPADAELIAYLDGELDAAAARRVEDRLDADAKLRSRADALKRSFDLLDFLPKPEPTATFATRTMDKLPVSLAVSGKAMAATTTTPLPSASSFATPMLVDSGELPGQGGFSWPWAAGLFLALCAALGAGYFGTAAARSYFAPTGEKQTGPDSLPLADVHVVENLPLYAAVDDLTFLHELASPELFGYELAVPEGAAQSPRIEVEKPSSKELEELWRAFQELPAERQENIRALDRDIMAMEAGPRDRTFRLLETYAAWLRRLAPPDRKEILAAATAGKRLDAIRELQRRQWVAALPSALRQKLKNLSAEEKADLIAKWRGDEDKHREEWALAHVRWEALRTGKQPWPFVDESHRKEVLDYLRGAYHYDDPKRNRLSSLGLQGGDAGRLQEALSRSEKGEWALLGKVAFDLAKKYETLPEPANGSPITTLADLKVWPTAHNHFEKKANRKLKVESQSGKWPEFALAVHREMSSLKQAINHPTHHLGPCRPGEFKPEVRKLLPTLEKKATAAEWKGLKALEGHWPAYPRELIRLARSHDLSVPGAMPPGAPSSWEKTYAPPRRPMRPGG
ncbi:MAG TPA: hypothetical protein VN641_13500 [Urbifossiella sp.]|nr:hypothetical protein [Urbifossiella sp.]